MASTSYDELSHLIITAIEEEQFFRKDVLIPKVRAIMKGFSLNLNATRYNALRKQSDIAKTLRAKERADEEKNYWRDVVRKLDPDNIQKYYDEVSKIHENK